MENSSVRPASLGCLCVTALPFISGKAEKDAEGPYPRGAHSLEKHQGTGGVCLGERAPAGITP